MCLIAFAYAVHPRFPLILIANRDEAHERPSLPLAEWADLPGVFGGRDLRAGGTWLAARRGRFAAVTNFREAVVSTAPKSRGELVRDFLADTSSSAAGYAEELRIHHDQFSPYNLLCWDGEELIQASNRPKPHWTSVEPGIHGLSNGVIDAPWPKLKRTTAALRNWLEALAGRDDGAVFSTLGPLFAALADCEQAADETLPDTGVGLELERALSPPFILGETYGTRASTLALISADGSTRIIERGFGPLAAPLGEHVAAF